MERWETVEWAIANGMVPISNVFGGHHYVNDFEAEDLDFIRFSSAIALMLSIC